MYTKGLILLRDWKRLFVFMRELIWNCVSVCINGSSLNLV